MSYKLLLYKATPGAWLMPSQGGLVNLALGAGLFYFGRKHKLVKWYGAAVALAGLAQVVIEKTAYIPFGPPAPDTSA